MNAKAILRANGAASLKQIKFPCYLKESKREIDALNLSINSEVFRAPESQDRYNRAAYLQSKGSQ